MTPFESIEQRRFLGSLPENLQHYERRDVRPLGNTVLIAPAAKKKQSEGGILLPDSSIWDGDQKQWIVMAVGPKVSDEIKVGRMVLFNPQLPNGVKYTFEDGSRWTLVDASRIEMIW